MECFHMTSRRPYWCPKTMKRRPCWCPKPVLWELNSFLMQTLSFVPINLHICWPREWKHSIPNSKKVAFAIGHWQLGIEHLGTRTQCNDLLEWPLNSSFPVHNSQCPKHSSLNQLYIWMKWFGISLLFTSFILLHEKFLQFDWLRAVVFQLKGKFI